MPATALHRQNPLRPAVSARRGA